jgi:1,2-diacylglycerol 3-alpha-glucosyltransferase
MRERTKVFLVCSGLGHIQRGFESFSQECFEALNTVSELDVTLFKGGGISGKKEIRIFNLPRQEWLARKIETLFRKNAYYIEQASFFFGLLPYLILKRPDVIYFSDGVLGNYLWHWRRYTGQNYKLLFSNGGPLSPPFDRWDHVQQVAPLYLNVALAAGVKAEKQSLVPYGLHLPNQLEILAPAELTALRSRLGLPVNRSVLLSVGAINKSHKRMNYLIREVARLTEPRPYLVILGHQDQETPEIIDLANQQLGVDNFLINTVSRAETNDYYRAADAFVLTSLGEGFGRVFLEGMAHGLPCLAHDYEVARFVLGRDGYFGDFESSGELTSLILHVLAEGQSESKRLQRYQSIYTRFSWNQLRPKYVDMIQTCFTSDSLSSM